MNILGYNLLPKPLARNVKACSLPRALGHKIALLKARGGSPLHSPLVVLAGQSCANRQQTLSPFLCMG